MNTLKVNWKVQAAKSAKDYLDYTHFSREGLIRQLTGTELYTQKQAEYGVDKVGLK